MWELSKWVASFFYLIATVSMFSPKIAATSTLPWTAYLIANIVWTGDSIHSKNWPWVTIAIMFVLLDILLIYARMVGFDILPYIQPLISIMETIYE
jgi:hypothetical protein